LSDYSLALSSKNHNLHAVSFYVVAVLVTARQRRRRCVRKTFTRFICQLFGLSLQKCYP